MLMAIWPAAELAPVASILSQPVSLLPSLPHSATIPTWAEAVGRAANGVHDASIIRPTKVNARRRDVVVMGHTGFATPFEGYGWLCLMVY